MGYGLVSKSLKANIYLNKRIRLTGYLKTKDVIGWSGFLLQIDDEIKKERLVYDNMSERDIEGTNDWKKYEVVLDVPSNATVINYGTMLAGGGQIWSYGINIEIVDTTGAGDLFAAGFLYGYTNGRDLVRSAKIGALAAAEVISHMGARPEADLRKLMVKEGL